MRAKKIDNELSVGVEKILKKPGERSASVAEAILYLELVDAYSTRAAEHDDESADWDVTLTDGLA